VARFYLNGEPRGTVQAPGPPKVGRLWLNVGCAEQIEGDFWHGGLAHMAIYPRVLTVGQIQNHYHQRNVAPNAIP
jgi:hypothetical protein